MNDYNVMLNDNKRLAWLDVSRGFAMFMVIYSHINMQSGPTHIMIFFRPIYLSIFFFVSGYLTKENFSFNGFFEHRTRTILFPFLFWGGVLILISQIYSINEEPIGLMDSFKELLSQYSDREHINTLWFLPFLYLSSIAFFILFNSAKVIEHSLYIAILCYFLNWVVFLCFFSTETSLEY